MDTILAKIRWRCGLDGFSWIDHDQHPWLQNKAIEHLPPANHGFQNREDLNRQLKQSQKTVSKAHGKPLPSLSPPKRQQKVKKQPRNPKNKR